jgi:hypothetical protein
MSVIAPRAVTARARMALAALRAESGAAAGGGVAKAGAGGRAERTGMLTGTVGSIAGAGVAGTCVFATSPAGISVAAVRPDGRYLLGSLRPGRYSLRVSSCPGDAEAGGAASSLGVAWPGFSGEVSVLAGQVKTVGPATIWRTAAPGARAVSSGNAGQPGTTAKSKTGSISGVVTGKGNPLRGVCVNAQRVSTGLGIGFYVSTRKNGTYKASDLAPGKYQVEFQAAAGCGNDGNWLSQWYPYVTAPLPTSKVINVVVRGGKVTSGIDAKMKLGGQISGIVRSATGKRLGGICVLINGQVPGVFEGFESATSKSGFYAAHGLFPGRYQVEFSIGCGGHGNYAFQWWRGTPLASHATTIKVAGTQVFKDISPTLLPGATIEGRVTQRSASGHPIRGVCVQASDNEGDDFADASTNHDGDYQLQGLAGGRFLVVFDPTCGGEFSSNYLGQQRWATVSSGRTRPGVNAYLRLGGGVSGLVTSTSGKPLGGVCVQVNDNDDDSAFTGSNGRYSIRGIEPGSYSVQFLGGCGNSGSLATQFYDDQPDLDSAGLVKLVAGETASGIDAVMRPGGTIAGIITGPSGQPLNQACVGASTLNQGETIGDYLNIVSTGSDGRYVLPNLTPGTYLLNLGCGGGRYAGTWFKSQADPISADLLAVHAGVTTTADGRLSRAGAISGTVTNKAGHPLANVCVYAEFARDGATVTSDEPETNRHGNYAIGGLTPGRYLISFSDCANTQRYGTLWYRDKLNATAATPVTVTGGHTATGINAALTFGGSITGTVTGPAGKPVAKVCVEGYDAASQSSGFANTSASGRYSMTGLASGSYAVYFTPCVGGGPNLGSISSPHAVRVTAPRSTADVNARLPLGGWVSGRVLGKSGASSVPLDQTCALVNPVRPDTNGPSIGFTNGSGFYTAADLAPGTYHVYFGDQLCDFYDGPVPFAPQWFNDQPTESTATTITVTAGAKTTKTDATLQLFGSIEGMVTGKSGRPVGGECVVAVPFRAQLDPLFDTPPNDEVAISGSTGRYSLIDLPPGKYKIEFTTGCGANGYAAQWWSDASSAAGATVISVSYATISAIDATLRR